jgi:hypothetical protein
MPTVSVGTEMIADSTSKPSTSTPNAAYCPSRKSCGPSQMKNCDVALFGSLVRAIEIAPFTCFSAGLVSSAIGGSVGFSIRSAVNPPPWITKPGITRWKIVST